MVFQQFNLFPHLTVLDNVTLAARRIRKMRREGRRGARPRAARAGGARGEGGAASAPALGRPAATRRDRAGADDGAARHALRRGHLGARPRARRRGPGRHAGAGAAGHDDDRRDPRDAVRPRGGRPPDLHGRGHGSSSRASPPSILDNPQEERTRRFLRRSLQLAHSLEELSINKEEMARMKRFYLSTAGVAFVAVLVATVGFAQPAKHDGSRARGRGDEAAAAPREHQVAQPLEHRREVRCAAVRLHRRPGQERRLRRRGRHAGSRATRSARAHQRELRSARPRRRVSRCSRTTARTS